MPADQIEHEHYDVDLALTELRRFRELLDNPLAQTSARLGDKLADGIGRHFAPEQLDLVGRVMVIVAASVGVLDDLPATVVANVVGFGGQHLVDGGDDRG